MYVVPPFLQFFCIYGFASKTSTNHGSCSIIVFTIEKNPHVSGRTQFKPVLLFQGQLYTYFGLLYNISVLFLNLGLSFIEETVGLR